MVVKVEEVVCVAAESECYIVLSVLCVCRS